MFSSETCSQLFLLNMYLIEKVLFDVEEMLAVFGAKRAVAREGRDVDLVDATRCDCVLGGDNRSK